MLVNTPIKDNSPGTGQSGGAKEHHHDNTPRTPKFRTSNVGRCSIDRVEDHLLQSFTSR